jgi:hypothetical protein
LNVEHMSPEDQTEIERAGRRCEICRSGRHWKQLSVVRAEGRDALVMCPACHARYGETPPATAARPAPAAPPVAAEVAPTPDEPTAKPKPPQEDRLKKALRSLPRGEHTTGQIAKAARLTHSKTLRRLHELEAAGEITQVGKRWSTERPSTDIEQAFDRLQSRTSNVRIVRDKARVG